MVPGKGIEPPHGYPYQILSLARLPVPPPRQKEILLMILLTSGAVAPMHPCIRDTCASCTSAASGVLPLAALILPVCHLPVPPPRHLAKDGKYKESRWSGKPVYPYFR